MLNVLPSASQTITPARDGDLRDEVRRRMDEDKDFQILRNALKIDSKEQQAKATDSPPTEQTAVSQVQQVDATLQMIEQRSLNLEVRANPEPQVTDPLVLDLSGRGIRTSGIDAGVRFDLNADGKAEQLSVPLGDAVLLALDRNGNGRIDDGRELFGDQHGAANGFEELARFDDNRDGRIDANDQVYQQLQVLRFASDGSQQLQGLKDAGVASISLDYRNTRIALNTYDSIAQTGSFTRHDGSEGMAADLLLAGRA